MPTRMIIVKYLKEEKWTRAIPQTLRSILESWDRPAARVAAKSYLSGLEEEETIK